MTEQTRAALVEIDRAAVKSAEWLHRRDAAILRALGAGCSLRIIADAAGMTPAGIAKIRDRGATRARVRFDG